MKCNIFLNCYEILPKKKVFYKKYGDYCNSVLKCDKTSLLVCSNLTSTCVCENTNFGYVSNSCGKYVNPLFGKIVLYYAFYEIPTVLLKDYEQTCTGDHECNSNKNLVCNQIGLPTKQCGYSSK